MNIKKRRVALKMILEEPHKKRTGEPISQLLCYDTRPRRRLARHPSSIRASTDQGQSRGSILLPRRAAALPRLDAGSGGVKPKWSYIIQNQQTLSSSRCMMYET